MRRINSFQIWFLVLVVAVVETIAGGDHYSIPDPVITVCPNKLKVTIPDADGIELFAFHGSINSELQGLQAGQFNVDVTRKDDNGQWTYVNEEISLHTNDVLSFWLYVQRFKRGFQRLAFSYVVSGWSDECEQSNNNLNGYNSHKSDIEPHRYGRGGYNHFRGHPYHHHHRNNYHSHRGYHDHEEETTIKTTESGGCATNSQMEDIKASLEFMTQQLSSLNTSSNQILYDFQNLSELMLSFIDKEKFGTKLILTGVPSATTSQLTDFLRKYLGLENVNVISVDETETGIVFQVPNASEKIRILARSNMLRGTDFLIKHIDGPTSKKLLVEDVAVTQVPEQDDETLNVDVRFGE